VTTRRAVLCTEPGGETGATTCDECETPIPYRTTCYAIPTGERIDGKPVIRIQCAQCHLTRSEVPF
jgi:RNase P subunit RPR2